MLLKVLNTEKLLYCEETHDSCAVEIALKKRKGTQILSQFRNEHEPDIYTLESMREAATDKGKAMQMWSSYVLHKQIVVPGFIDYML